MGTIILIVCLVIMALCGAGLWALTALFGPSAAKPSAAQKRKAAEDAQRRIVCAHCQQAGHVTARPRQRKQGVSGGKATAGLLTGGISLVAVGLSKKGWITEMSCGNCGMTWDIT